MRTERILHVEDNDINRELMRAQLGHLGFATDFALDAREAIELARSIPYDLILMDCQLPGMDGLAAARAIRAAEPPGRHAIIIAITANVLPGYRETCIAAGMDDYLTKPLLLDPLARMLARWLPEPAP